MKPMHRRTLSSTDPKSTEKILFYLQQQELSLRSTLPFIRKDVSKSTMVIPQQYNEEILSRCCDLDILQQLEQKRVINWYENARPFVPMFCESDGNSLLHSACLYVFGIHDRQFIFRNLVYQLLFMEHEGSGQLYKRWNSDHQNLVQQIVSSKSSFFQEESMKKWDHMKFTCSTDPGAKKRFNDLEPVHVFAISNILGRPIVIVMNTMCATSDADVVQGLRFEGIYLPLLRDPSDCEKSPIVIAYELNQFVPLFSTEKAGMLTKSKQTLDTAQHCIPLQKCDSSQLPIRYLLDEEQGRKQAFLRAYIDTFPAPYRGGNLEAACIKFKAPSAHSIELLWSFQSEMNKESMPVKLPPSQQYLPMQHQYQPFQQNFMFQGNLPSRENLGTQPYQPLQQQHQNVTPSPQNSTSKQQSMLLQQQKLPSQQYTHISYPPSQPQLSPKAVPQQQQHQVYEAVDDDIRYDHQYALVSDISSIKAGKPCERSKIGCKNFASFENGENLCTECYEKYKDVRKQTRKRTTTSTNRQKQQQIHHPSSQEDLQHQRYPYLAQQQPPMSQQNPLFFQQPYQQLQQQIQKPAGQPQLQNHYNVSQPQPIPCVTCGVEKGIPELDNACKTCYHKSMFQSFQKTTQSLMNESAYEYMAPAFSNGNNSLNRNKEGNYGKIDIPSLNEKKNKEEEERFTCNSCDKSVVGWKNGFGLCEECLQKLKQKQSDLEGKKSLEEKNKNEAAAATYSGFGEADAVGGEPHEYNKRKVYCAYAGCCDVICDYSDKFCENHYEKKSTKPHEYNKRKVYCAHAGCYDVICDYSDKFCENHYEKKPTMRCLICDKNPAEDNDCGACITCLQTQENVLKEMKEELQKKAQQNVGVGGQYREQRNVNVGRGPAPLSGFENLDDVMESLPPLPPPTQTRYPANDFAVGAGFQQQQQQLRQPQALAFRAPTVYPAFQQNGPRDHDATLNWQKGSARCTHCDLPANPHNSGLCNKCFADKQNMNANQQQQQHYAQIPQHYPQRPQTSVLLSETMECINGDKRPANAEKNFLCDQCYEEQLQKYQTQQPNPQMQNNSGPKPCATRGCVQMSAPSSALCHNCRDGNYPGYQPQLQQQQEFAPQHPPSILPGAGGERVHCLSLDCDFFGSKEFGGYCSSCFMEITKAEAGKKKQAGIQSYIPEEVVMPGNDLNGRGPVRSLQGFHDTPLLTQQHPAAIGFTMNPVEIGHGVNQYAGKPCRNPTCTMFGNDEWDGLCSSCAMANVLERDGGVT